MILPTLANEIKTLKYWVAFQRVSLTSWGEGGFLALVGHPSSVGVTTNLELATKVFVYHQVKIPG